MLKDYKINYADDDITPVKTLMRMRIPPLIIGLLLGVLLSFITSRFEEVLAHNIKVAFFIPFIVYMADAVGTQTQNIYVRDLKSGKANFKKYLIKESILGIILGLATGLATALITSLWFSAIDLTLAVSLAMFTTIAIAPVVALAVTEILQLEHKDPAVGSGPIATVIQDTLSVLIYGLIASTIIL